MFERPEAIAALGDFSRLRFSRREYDARARIVHDVGEAVERFVKINRYGYRAHSLYRKIGDVPFRTVRRQDRHSVAGFYS